MQQNKICINKWLIPFSYVYGLIVFIRNKLFSLGVLKQKSYQIPIICVGNISVGGTGKTPHIEYLIKLLQNKYQIAVLSRGYKRKSKGFRLATSESSAKEIGDEPFQIKQKFPDIIVAVDAKRTRGIKHLLKLPEEQKPDVILLDDAYQHRYVKPSLSILLTEYNRLITQDRLLPAGRLREPAHLAELANIIVVTKCPSDINPLEQRIVLKELQPYPYQDLVFTNISYGKITPIFNQQEEALSLNKLTTAKVLIVSGIANPDSLHSVIKQYAEKVDTFSFKDHHSFSKRDITSIKRRFDEIQGQHKLIITTEKDAARLHSLKKLPEEIKPYLYYIPIEITFVTQDYKYMFDNKIKKHVEQSSTDC